MSSLLSACADNGSANKAAVPGISQPPSGGNLLTSNQSESINLPEIPTGKNLSTEIAVGKSTNNDNEKSIMRKSVMNALLFRSTKGPTLQAKKVSPKEIKEKGNLDHEFKSEVPSYILEAKDFSPGDSYTLYCLNMCYDSCYMGEFFVTNEGQLISKKNNKPIETNIIFSGSYMNGEYSSWVLLSEDQQTCVAAVITPNPIEFEWADGAYVTLIMQTPDASQFIISGKGFKPNESFTFASRNYDERLSFKHKASSDGTLSTFFLPAVINKEGGVAIIKIKRHSTKEIGTFKCLWGCDAQKKSPI